MTTKKTWFQLSPKKPGSKYLKKTCSFHRKVSRERFQRMMMISNVWQINCKCNCKLPRCLVSKGGWHLVRWHRVFWHKLVLSIDKTDFIKNLDCVTALMSLCAKPIDQMSISKKYLFTYLLELFLSRKCKWLCTIADENNCFWYKGQGGARWSNFARSENFRQCS